MSKAEAVRASEKRAEARGAVFIRGRIRVDPPYAQQWKEMLKGFGQKGAVQELLHFYMQNKPK